MKKLFLALMLLMTILSLASTVVEAKPKASKSHAAEVAKPAEPEEQAVEEAPPPDTSWKGVVGGWVLAAGAGGLAARIGMQPATFGVLALLLLLAVLVFVLLLMMSASRRRRGRRNAKYAGDYSNSMSSDRPAKAEPKFESRVKHGAEQSKARATGVDKSKSRVEVPADFDLNKFLRSANALFLRLQSAWDNADLGAIREFVDDEIHEEFRLQLRSRGDALNKTGVDSFDSKLLKLDSAGKIYVAVVKFKGMVHEEGNPSKSFMEVWSMSKPKAGAEGWTVTAIQQFL
jgi:predicted lipid-binding transport protein (Tim44 family)